jgi:hypothetical protein
MSQFVADCNWHRKEIKRVAADVKKFLEQTKIGALNNETDGIEDVGEMLSNITISYRHLEDAGSRLGKAIQAKDGGVSVYDKATTVGA